MFKLLFLMLSIFLAGCSSNERVPEEVKLKNIIKNTIEQLDEPKIVEYIGYNVNGYKYEGHKIYPGNLGYSLKYRNINNSKNYLDTYIWPVTKNAEVISHETLVSSMAKQALGDIYGAQNSGHYQNVRVVFKDMRVVSERNVEFYKLNFSKKGVEFNSYLYVSESKGRYLKSRITMPSRNSVSDKDVNNLVFKVFEKIIANIEKT